MGDDDVQLTDLEVIQQFSLAVRGATATRREVVAALEADLAYLTGGSRRRAAAPAPAAPRPTRAPVTKAAPVRVAAAKAPARRTAVKQAAPKATRSRRA